MSIFKTSRLSLGTDTIAHVADAIAETGGATVQFQSADNGRYVVGLHGFTMPYQGSSLTHRVAAIAAAFNYAKAFVGVVGFGFWVHEGILHVDAVRFFSDRERAKRCAKDYGQIAAFDTLTGSAWTV